MDYEKIVLDNMIFRAVGGSHGYGLATETSDEDLRGAFITPPELHLGMFSVDNYRPSDGGDIHYCSLQELTKLMADGAPNWTELLFLLDRTVQLTTPWWERIVANRHLFLSKHTAKKAFGFISNMHRRSAGNKNRVDPELIAKLSENAHWEPMRAEMEAMLPLPVTNQVVEQIKMIFRRWLEADQKKAPTPDKISELEALARKQAMHGIRMGRMTCELLETGKFNVDRSFERDDLLAIKRGERDLESAYEEAARLTARIDELLPTSKLPEHADRERISGLVVSVTKEYWRWKGWA